MSACAQVLAVYYRTWKHASNTHTRYYVLVLYRHVEDIVPTIKLHYNKTRNDLDFLRVYYAYIYYFILIPLIYVYIFIHII